ncbi:hypothetical protein GN156_39525, partial [bacterium LRH843]|nr:hypothetical protein [bacterium LRH843]
AREYTAEDRKRSRLNIVCKSMLFQSLDNNMLNRVKNLSTAKEVWDKIIEVCEGSDKIKKNRLELALQRFKSVRMKE